MITVHNEIIDQCKTTSIRDEQTVKCRICNIVSEDMFHLQRHNDSVYESNPNKLTETICDKMIDCGTSVGGKQISENELFNKPILEDRLNEAQKSHISNICEKISPTKKGF